MLQRLATLWSDDHTYFNSPLMVLDYLQVPHTQSPIFLELEIQNYIFMEWMQDPLCLSPELIYRAI